VRCEGSHPAKVNRPGEGQTGRLRQKELDAEKKAKEKDKKQEKVDKDKRAREREAAKLRNFFVAEPTAVGSTPRRDG
jgi:hypothetical protein